MLSDGMTTQRTLFFVFGVLRISFHVSLGFNCCICEDSCQFALFKSLFYLLSDFGFSFGFHFQQFLCGVSSYEFLFNLSCLELNLCMLVASRQLFQLSHCFDGEQTRLLQCLLHSVSPTALGTLWAGLCLCWTRTEGCRLAAPPLPTVG